ncbi:glycosyltransferase family 4 protein [Helicobacter brantae]|uniref:Glycosyltransferase family 4 protein n=1 Tax=Helicobacter brantae TaxID=375927 RepID=A0A3D8J0Z0_9HELI|nr:glycosyltransferase family 4 protein [Helicobacter brantae]RDU71148.1 glycosyltransferase family 4 protein [Helicobacter brantae]
MNICIVLRDITEKGGGERVCVNLANALSLEHRVRIISYYKSQNSPIYALNPQVQVEYLERCGERSGGKIGYLFKKIFYRYILTLKARKSFKQDDIIIANDRALAQIFKLKDKKYIRIWHLNFPKRKRNLDFFDEVVILSHKEEKKWKQCHPHISVIPNFLPTFPTKQADSSSKICLSVGRMDRGDQKGFLRLVDIFAKIQPKIKDWKLYIVGEGTLKEEIKNKIDTYGLQDCIFLKPFTPEIQKEYLQASLYVMSSHFEGLPLVLLESGSYGLPSVAFDICAGPSDIIEDEKTGFLIEDGDLEGFASKMEILMQNQELRRDMGQRAKERIQAQFSQEKILEEWNKLFTQLQIRNLQSPL